MTVRSARRRARSLTLAIGTILGLAVAAATGNAAQAAVVPTVTLGTAASFGVLAGSTVTNTGPTVVNGLSVGVNPGSAVVGFPPGVITAPGVKHVNDAVAVQAQADVTTAYLDAAGRTPAPADSGLTDLSGKTLAPGVYQGGELGLTGTVTLDNRTDPDAVFIFQAASSLITGSSSVVAFTTPHVSCNVFWQVTSSATLGAGSNFAGTILALSSVTANTGATIRGRLFARTGAVTLDNNTIIPTACAAVGPTTTPTTPTTPTTATSTSRSTSTRTPTNPNQSQITTSGSRITPSTTPTTSSLTSGRRTTGSSSTNTVGSGSTTPTTTSPGLAITGRDVGGPLLVGILSVVAGGGVLLIAARRRSTDGRHEPGSS